MGNGEWGMGNGESVSRLLLPIPYSPLPIPHWLLLYFFLADQSPENPPADHLPPISVPVRLPGN